MSDQFSDNEGKVVSFSSHTILHDQCDPISSNEFANDNGDQSKNLVTSLGVTRRRLPAHNNDGMAAGGGTVRPHNDPHDGLTPVGTPEKTYKSTSKTGSNEHMVNDSDLEKGDDGCLTSCCAPESNPLKLIFRILACVCAGLVFGLALEKSRVFETASIRGQMILERWIMLKTFLAAMGTGQLVLAIISVLPWTKERFRSSYENYADVLKCKGLFPIVVGTFLLGSGMTLSGACPGMVLAQVGSWTKNSIYTLVGVLIGSLVFGLVADHVSKIKYVKPTSEWGTFSVHETLNLPYIAVALPMVFFIAVAVVLMEVFIDWEEDLDPGVRNGENSGNIFEMKSWPPSVAGVLIGILQFIVVFAVGDTLGGSSSYQTVVSQWVVTKKLKETFPYMANARCGLGNWWQVFYVVAAMLGAFISSQASDMFAENRGVTAVCAVCGGFMLAIGARFASGCTSGHGLSGAALLFWLSLVAVPVMFAGGICTGFLMKASGALNDYECFDATDICDQTIIG